MKARSPVRPYKWLARYYDTIFRFHHPWSQAARERILGPILPAVESACDLACGTGSTALAMARQCIKMYAVDLSPGMCRMAREKARKAKLPLRVLCADMRNFRLPEPVDLITCEFDAINHVPRKSDLKAVARSAARALRPGGYFYFDANNKAAFEKAWPLTWWIEESGVAVVMHGGHDGKHRAWSDVEWFIQEGALWRRRHERVEEVCWTHAEIREALASAGFASIRRWDGAPFFQGKALVEPGHRTYYLARKRR